MKGIMSCQDCIIELWKSHCEECRIAGRIVVKLEEKGYTFDKYHIDSIKGREVWNEYLEEINENNKKLGYVKGEIYAPTFINPKTGEVLAFSNRAPSNEELTRLVKGGGKI